MDRWRRKKNRIVDFKHFFPPQIFQIFVIENDRSEVNLNLLE